MQAPVITHFLVPGALYGPGTNNEAEKHAPAPNLAKERTNSRLLRSHSLIGMEPVHKRDRVRDKYARARTHHHYAIGQFSSKRVCALCPHAWCLRRRVCIAIRLAGYALSLSRSGVSYLRPISCVLSHRTAHLCRRLRSYEDIPPDAVLCASS